MTSVAAGVLKQIQPISQQMDSFLKKSGLPAKFFAHDMTFENGMAALLGSNAQFTTHYHLTRPELIFTDPCGRTLADGAYLSHHLFNQESGYEEQVALLKKEFSFHHSLLIAVNEKDQQNLYSFQFACDEKQFLHHVLNHGYLYQRFIKKYNAEFSAIIESEREENQVDFPLLNLPRREDPSFSLFDDEMSQFSDLSGAYGEMTDLLSPQQLKCFSLLVKGACIKQIAAALNLTCRTVEHYLEHVRAKLKCRSTKELIARYASQIN